MELPGGADLAPRPWLWSMVKWWIRWFNAYRFLALKTNQVPSVPVNLLFTKNPLFGEFSYRLFVRKRNTNRMNKNKKNVECYQALCSIKCIFIDGDSLKRLLHVSLQSSSNFTWKCDLITPPLLSFSTLYFWLNFSPGTLGLCALCSANLCLHSQQHNDGCLRWN